MVKLNILCVSHEVTSIRSLHRRPVQCCPYCRRLVDTWFSLIDFKEVTVHWAHGNAVVNHTLCVFRWLIFQFPRSPVSCPSFGRYWCPAPDINRASNVSSVKTNFRCKRSFLSIAGAKVQQFGVENKFFRYRFFRCVCKCLTDSALQWYFENQLLHFDRIGRKWRKRLRILEKRSFPVMVIFGQNHFRGRSVILYYNINIFIL